MALYLGFTKDDEARFDKDNDSVSEKVIAMLNEWKHKQAEDATRSKLMEALVRARRRDLADKVCSYQA